MFSGTTRVGLSLSASAPELVASGPRPSGVRTAGFLPVSYGSPFAMPVAVQPVCRLAYPYVDNLDVSETPHVTQTLVGEFKAGAYPSSGHTPVTSVTLVVCSLVVS